MNPEQLAGWFLVIMGIGTVIGQLYIYFQFRACKNWTSTLGEVTDSVVRKDYNSGKGRALPYFTYTPTVKFQYVVDGTTYFSSKVTHHDFFYDYLLNRKKQ